MAVKWARYIAVRGHWQLEIGHGSDVNVSTNPPGWTMTKFMGGVVP